MTSSSPAASLDQPKQGLPEGWTRHTLNGREFYYHKATNVTSESRPEVALMLNDGPKQQAETEATNATSAEATTKQEQPQQAKPTHTQPPQAEPSQVQPLQAQPLQALQSSVPAERLEAVARKQPPPLMLTASAPPASEPPTPTAVAPSRTTTASLSQVQQPVASTDAAIRTMELKVRVPEPGLVVGQQLAFPALEGALRQQGQGMLAVTIEENVAPGSVVTVKVPMAFPQAASQLPAQMAAQPASQSNQQHTTQAALQNAVQPSSRPARQPLLATGLPPAPAAQESSQTTSDRARSDGCRGVQFGWWMYAAGWLLLLLLMKPAAALCLWAAAAFRGVRACWRRPAQHKALVVASISTFVVVFLSWAVCHSYRHHHAHGAPWHPHQHPHTHQHTHFQLVQQSPIAAQQFNELVL